MKLICTLTAFLLLANHAGFAVKNKNTKPAVATTTTTSIYHASHLAEAGLKEDVFALALKGFTKLRDKGLVNADSMLTIIDYSQSSREKRLYVIDLKNQELEFNSLVSHGRNSGYEFAKSFSNKYSSNKSSLGFYITKNTYFGENGYSLKLEGTEPGFNDKALQRAIVMHGAPYVTESIIWQKGYLGRSLGCPAVPQVLHKQIIDKIKNGNALFVYYPQETYLEKSRWLR